MAKGASSVGVRSTLIAFGLACLATVGTSSCVIDAVYVDPCPCDRFINLCETQCSCDPDCGGGPVTGGGYEDTPCVDSNDCSDLAQECLINDKEQDSWCAGTCASNRDCNPDGCCLLADNGDAFCYPPRYCGDQPTDGGPGDDVVDGGPTADATDGGPTADVAPDAAPADGGTPDAAVDAATDAAPVDGGTPDAAPADAAPADATTDTPPADGGV